jgi:FMN phosphatase YigB (HAD superfamily)
LQVVLLGKPAPAIYEGAMEMLKVQDPKQVLAIGDSMEHDIAGQHPLATIGCRNCWGDSCAAGGQGSKYCRSAIMPKGGIPVTA